MEQKLARTWTLLSSDAKMGKAAACAGAGVPFQAFLTTSASSERSPAGRKIHKRCRWSFHAICGGLEIRL
jgi:hypothetical protein